MTERISPSTAASVFAHRGRFVGRRILWATQGRVKTDHIAVRTATAAGFLQESKIKQQNTVNHGSFEMDPSDKVVTGRYVSFFTSARQADTQRWRDTQEQYSQRYAKPTTKPPDINRYFDHARADGDGQHGLREVQQRERWPRERWGSAAEPKAQQCGYGA